MALNDDEIRYKNVIDTLKSLPKVNAPNNFETELMRKINSETIKEKQTFWEKFLLPSRLVPSAALAVSAVILLFVLNINAENPEDPLLMEPKVREDLIQTENISGIPLQQKFDAQKDRRENTADQLFKEQSTDTGYGRSKSGVGYSNAEFSIDKSGLNFRQVNLSNEEQEQLIEVKERFRILLKTSGNN